MRDQAMSRRVSDMTEQLTLHFEEEEAPSPYGINNSIHLIEQNN